MKCSQVDKALILIFLGLIHNLVWVEMSLVWNKSDKHTTIYDSYNFEKAAQFIKSIELEKSPEAQSLKNTKKLNIPNKTQKRMLYKQFFEGVVKWERRRSQMGSGLPIETILKTAYNVGKKV